jgi:hypothetical protein
MCVFDHLLVAFFHRYHFSLMGLVVWSPGVASDQYMSYLQCIFHLQQSRSNPLSASANFFPSLARTGQHTLYEMINLVIP